MAYTVKIIASFDDLKQYQTSWADLWERSHVSTPTPLICHLERCLSTFDRQFYKAILIFEKSKLIAGLTLMKAGRRFGFRKTSTVNKMWQDCSELLVDSDSDFNHVTDALIESLSHFDVSVVDLLAIRSQRHPWPLLLHKLANRFGYCQQTSEYQSAIIKFCDWETFEAGLSKNIRKSVRRRERQLAEVGDVTYESYDNINGAEVESLLQRGFQLEKQGWKSRLGKPILHHPKIHNLLLAQAKDYAARGWLRVHFLKLSGKDVAFDYGWFTKGVYHSYKTAYDETLHRFSPGQILVAKILKELSQSNELVQFDVLGRITEATRCWGPEYVTVSDITTCLSPTAKRAFTHYNRLKSISIGKWLYHRFKPQEVHS